MYTTLLSDGQMMELIPGGSNMAVRYEDRSAFIRLVQKARLDESKPQVARVLLCVWACVFLQGYVEAGIPCTLYRFFVFSINHANPWSRLCSTMAITVARELL